MKRKTARLGRNGPPYLSGQRGAPERDLFIRIATNLVQIPGSLHLPCSCITQSHSELPATLASLTLLTDFPQRLKKGFPWLES